MQLPTKVRLIVVGILVITIVVQGSAHVAAAGTSARSVLLAGVNMSGAEFKSGKENARPGFDYVYPTNTEISWAASHHMTVIRLPVEWSRLQPALSAAIDPAEWGRVLSVVQIAHSYNIRVVLDLHDYGTWRGRVIGSAAVPNSVFADTWRRIASLAANQPSMILGLMNEPHLQSAEQWEESTQAALNAIRGTGARNLVLVSGTKWDGAHSWTSGGLASNAAAMDRLSTEGGPVAFEFHQYFDHDFSGTKPDCLTPVDAVRTLEPATAWLEAGHRQGFLGEFAVTGSSACLSTLDAVLTYLNEHRAQWIGWTYWAAGAWWGNYMFSVEPLRGVERPQMSVLSRHLP